MRWRRMIVAACILSATVYVSHYGGTISYLLFFATVLVPCMAIGYICYVFSGFKIYQKIETRSLIKGQEVSYYFNLSNESMTAFTSVAVSFISDTQEVKDMEEKREYCLLPGESIKKSTTLLAKYRGEYDIGIDSVTIKDFFNIFSLTYACRSKIRAKVLPRIIKLKSLSFMPENEEVKWDKMQVSFLQEIPSGNVRTYMVGDDKKRIHWKLSAARDELMVKQYTSLPQAERIVVFDLKEANGDRLQRMRCEDKAVETVLAIVNYLYRHKIAARILYETDAYHEMLVRSLSEFENFYQFCSEVNFKREVQAERMLCGQTQMASYILVTCHPTKELYATCYLARQSGNKVTIILIRDETESEEVPKGLVAYTVGPDDELQEKLSGRGW